MAKAIKVLDRDHWHDLRTKTIGGSEVATLFGCGRESYYTLWHRKAEGLTDDASGERLKWGNRLEPVIAKGIAEDEGLKIEKVHQYLLHKCLDGMGASLDYRILNHDNGPGALEIKNVDSLVFHTKFDEGESGLEAPPHIELQLQHQLAVTGYEWGIIGVLVGGNQPKVIQRKRIPAVIDAIEKKIAAFWDSIKKGDEPKILEDGDFKTFQKVFRPAETRLELSPTQDLWRRLENYAYRQSLYKEAKTKLDEGKADLLNLFKDNPAEVLAIPNESGQLWELSYKLIEKPEHTVKATSYRQLRVKEPKA